MSLHVHTKEGGRLRQCELDIRRDMGLRQITTGHPAVLLIREAARVPWRVRRRSRMIFVAFGRMRDRLVQCE